MTKSELEEQNSQLDWTLTIYDKALQMILQKWFNEENIEIDGEKLREQKIMWLRDATESLLNENGGNNGQKKI